MEQRTPKDLYETLMKPVSAIVAQMESDGIRIDKNSALELEVQFNQKILEHYKELVNNIGIRFNYRSSLQLQYVLEKVLGHKLTKLTKKGGKALDSEVISEIVEMDKRLAPLRDMKHYSKLISTYIRGPLNNLRPDGRIMVNWQLLGTETGRWSSRMPFPVQVIPREKRMRNLIIPEDGYVLGSWDFDQAELYVLAYYSGDAFLKEGALGKKDMHAYGAALFYECSPDEIIEGRKSSDEKIRNKYTEMRQISKNGMFLLVYRGGPYALSKTVGIPLNKAEKFHNAFLKKAPKIMEWSNSVVNKLERDNFVISCYGRIRRFPLYDMLSENEQEKAQKEAPNALIQGTSVDFCSYSLIEACARLKKQGFMDIDKKKRVKALVQKHDELVFEIPEDWIDKVAPIITEAMISPKLPMNIPMSTSPEFGYKYGEMKKYNLEK